MHPCPLPGQLFIPLITRLTASSSLISCMGCNTVSCRVVSCRGLGLPLFAHRYVPGFLEGGKYEGIPRSSKPTNWKSGSGENRKRYFRSRQMSSSCLKPACCASRPAAVTLQWDGELSPLSPVFRRAPCARGRRSGRPAGSAPCPPGCAPWPRDWPEMSGSAFSPVSP